jgi:hypothetical protein
MNDIDQIKKSFIGRTGRLNLIDRGGDIDINVDYRVKDVDGGTIIVHIDNSPYNIFWNENYKNWDLCETGTEAEIIRIVKQYFPEQKFTVLVELTPAQLRIQHLERIPFCNQIEDDEAFFKLKVAYLRLQNEEAEVAFYNEHFKHYKMI